MTSIERRWDTDASKSVTHDELLRCYRGKYSKKELEQYWKSLRLVTKKGQLKDQPKYKIKKIEHRAPSSGDAVIERLASCTVVPVIKIDDANHAIPLVTALKAGGVDVAEITFRSECAAEAIRQACTVEGICVGAGSVLHPKQVDEAVQAGAEFIISPGFSVAVHAQCKKRGVLYLPGAVTPTEVMTATSKFGLKVLKFFPASDFGGVNTLKSYGAVFPDVSFMPTGGVTEKNIGDYVSLPNIIAAGGSWFVKDAAIIEAASSGDWSAVTAGAKKASETAKTVVTQ